MVIGLTGGIATGKSHVSRLLANLGYRIVDADLITHHLQQPGQPGLKTIVDHFGSRFLDRSGNLNRRKLGRLVFSNPRKLHQLVRILDPLIRHEIIRQLATDWNRKTVLDAPTLFENGYQYLADRIVVVACSPVHQLQRLHRRDQLPLSAASRRIASQWPLAIKERLADVVINSDGTFSQTQHQVIALVHRHQL